MISIDLEPEDETKLDALATEEGKSTSEWVRAAILDLLDDIEDRRIAEERLRNPGRRYTHEEIEREFGLED